MFGLSFLNKTKGVYWRAVKPFFSCMHALFSILNNSLNKTESSQIKKVHFNMHEMEARLFGGLVFKHFDTKFDPDSGYVLHGINRCVLIVRFWSAVSQIDFRICKNEQMLCPCPWQILCAVRS